jgi:hypothetical protein
VTPEGFRIARSNFGSSGPVLIDGISAPVASWESTRIVAYNTGGGAFGTKEELLEIAGHAEHLVVEVSHLLQSRPWS